MMRVIGYDKNHRLVQLPNTLEEYFSGAAKRFSHIAEIWVEYGSATEQVSVSGGVMKGDFALLRAFLADHDGALLVRIDKVVELFFPAYLYGFVEDTFARAIHHKIEGSGYACRECVGKYEIRLREYDRLLRRVADDDKGAAVRMAFCRLLYPIDLADAHRQGYEDFLKENDAFALETLAAGESDLAEEVGYLTEHKLLSKSAVDDILPKLSEERYAEAVAVLLRYGKRGRRRLQV